MESIMMKTACTSCLVCVAIVASACASSDSASSSFPFSRDAPRSTFADVFEVVDTLALKGAGVADGVLFARFDGQTFTIARPTDRQVSVHAADGSEVAVLEEFFEPMSARRINDGRVLVVDGMRLVVVPEDISAERETVTTPLLAFDALDLGDERYLITGVLRWSRHSSEGRPAHLHVWNTATMTIEQSFFSPPRVDFLDDVASDGEWANAAVRGDTIWAVSGFADSIFVFRTDGVRIDAFALPLIAHSKPESAGDKAPMQWSIERIDLLADGRNVVQLGDKMSFDDLEETRYLVVTGRDGETETTLVDTPMLRVVTNDLFYFEDPARTGHNHWIVARLRASR